MKRAISLLLVTLLLAGALPGCGGTERQATPFTAQNEILTYEKVDGSKTQLTVSMLGNNANVKDLSEAFEALNPDVQVICIDVTGGSAGYRPIVDWVTHGAAPDVMFVNPDSFVDDAQIMEYFEDLSANPAVDNFEAAALDRVAIEGRAYFLPAPSEINCMIYNRTLFDQYGWQVPVTFDDFLALCRQITADTGGAVQPWNPNAKYNNVLVTALEAFTYEELFGGVDNRAWYNDFCRGEATFAGHMEPFYERIQTLIDEGVLREEHFAYSATTRGKEFEAGQIAMINAPVSIIGSEEYVFDFKPYPTTSGELGYVNDYFSALLCVPKKEHTDAEQDAIDRFIDFYSSVEGQQTLIGTSLQVSNVKDVPLSQMKALAGIEAVIAQGHKFNRLDFPGPGKRTWTLREDALRMATGESTGAECISAIDRRPYKDAGEPAADPGEKLATVTEDFTILEFSCYIADMYRERTGADVGLINHGVAYRGNLVRLFAGDVYESYINPIKPRSFGNGSTLVKLSMTGQQLLDALNHPVGNECVTDSVYAFSGLKCEIAPWNPPREKYRSVKMADGTALDPKKEYTVAAWDGTIGTEYVTEIQETFEGTFEELMSAKMKADGTISPARDGRVRLVWE